VDATVSPAPEASTATASPRPAVPMTATAEATPAVAKPYAWATTNRAIAHALGSYPSGRESETQEAFERQYARGFRVLEVDLVYTRDKRLVARHDWAPERFEWLGIRSPSRIPTLAQFKSALVRNKYTPLAVEDLVVLMRKHPDVYLMTDVKDADTDLLAHALRDLLHAAGNDPSVRDRVIVQIYQEADLAPVRALGFHNVVYTFYHLTTSKARGLRFAATHGIRVVTVESYLATPSFVRQARSQGLTVAVHTLNKWKQAAAAWKLGVALVYTDRLNP
jgi:glycerophosphoryl diester phosphodiesterase